MHVHFLTSRMLMFLMSHHVRPRSIVSFHAPCQIQDSHSMFHATVMPQSFHGSVIVMPWSYYVHANVQGHAIFMSCSTVQVEAMVMPSFCHYHANFFLLWSCHAFAIGSFHVVGDTCNVDLVTPANVTLCH